MFRPVFSVYITFIVVLVARVDASCQSQVNHRGLCSVGETAAPSASSALLQRATSRERSETVSQPVTKPIVGNDIPVGNGSSAGPELFDHNGLVQESQPGQDISILHTDTASEANRQLSGLGPQMGHTQARSMPQANVKGLGPQIQKTAPRAMPEDISGLGPQLLSHAVSQPPLSMTGARSLNKEFNKYRYSMNATGSDVLERPVMGETSTALRAVSEQAIQDVDAIGIVNKQEDAILSSVSLPNAARSQVLSGTDAANTPTTQEETYFTPVLHPSSVSANAVSSALTASGEANEQDASSPRVSLQSAAEGEVHTRSAAEAAEGAAELESAAEEHTPGAEWKNEKSHKQHPGEHRRVDAQAWGEMVLFTACVALPILIVLLLNSRFSMWPETSSKFDDGEADDFWNEGSVGIDSSDQTAEKKTAEKTK